MLCVFCGVPFVAKRSYQAHCSPRCVHAKWRAAGKRRAEPVLASCPECLTPFLRTNPARRYCSRNCKDRLAARLSARRRPKTEARRAIQRMWARAHAEENARRSREWADKNPEGARRRKITRRARERSAEGTWTLAEWRALVDAHAGRCAYCGRADQLTIDHRIPLARGGRNSIDNLLPACATCNRQKACRGEEEFRMELRAHRDSERRADSAS